MTIGSGGYSVAFASGLSPAPLSRFQSPLSEPDVRFSRISALQWDHAVSHAGPRSHPWTTPMGLAPVPYSIHVRSRSAARPVDALTTPSSSDDPFTFACDASGVSGPFTGVSGFRHSRDPSPFGHRSSPEAPSLHRHYPASPVLRASPPPCRPASPSRGPGSVRASPPTGLPMLLPPSPSMRADVTTPAVQRGARVARFPLRLRPSPFLRWVGPRIARFRGLLDVHSRSGPHGR